MNILNNVISPILIGTIFIIGVLIIGRKFKEYVKEVKSHNKHVEESNW